TGAKADHDKDGYGEKDKEHGKDSWQGKHEKPYGGMHTGGGALALVNADDWEKGDEGGYEKGSGKDKEHGKDSWQGKHEKPRGGMHTGGGALAGSPGMTAGGLAVLAVAGTGLYALRRQKASQGAA
ncbi:hypothetical protein ACFW7K_16325, partial [Streptomyces sp. NPDC058735]